MPHSTKNVSCVFVFAIVSATCAPAYSQATPGVAGTWSAQSGNWTAVLRVDGSKVVGAVRNCASAPIEISEGVLNGDTITFKCKNRDADRTVAFTGKVHENEIALSWELSGTPPSDDNPFWGAAAPHQFTAKRIPDGSDLEIAEMASHAIWKGPSTVTFDRILHADSEPQNWLTYSGMLLGQRYSQLTQLTPVNVKDLEIAWIWQVPSRQKFEATPLVVDGVIYTVQPLNNNVVALEADTGRVLWTYTYTPRNFRVCCGSVNRGLAILGNTLFMGTLDAHLLAISASTGKLIWNTTVADSADPSCDKDTCYSITHAPLVVKDEVIVGTAGSEGKIRSFIAAYDAATGAEVWRFYTVPAAGESGNDTWSGDSWKTGGAGVWNTGSYDAETNLTFWGTGNPYPPPSGDGRLGDNLYSDSVVALDADTGKLKWYYQFTPHDVWDWDSTQIPVLADIQWQGQSRKVMLWANRNGLMYVLDRITGQFLLGKPFVEVNWMNGFDEKGRPNLIPLIPRPSDNKTLVSPVAGTSWDPPSFSPSTGLFYIPAWDSNGNQWDPSAGVSPGNSAVRAFDPQTGEMRWEFKRDHAVFHGVLTTASGLLFTGVGGDSSNGLSASRLADGYFYALNARTGELIWKMALGGTIQSGPMSYSVNGKQYVAVTAGNNLFAFALRQ